MTISSERLARESAKRPWLVVGIWIAATVVSAVLWFNLIESGTTQGQGMFTVEPEAVKAQRLLVESDIRDERLDTEIMVIRHDSLTVDDPQFRERIDKVYAQILALDSDPNGPVLHDPRSLPNLNLLPPGAAEMLIASDRTGTFIPITLAASGHAEGILEIAESNSTDGFDIAVAGEAATGEDFRKVAKRDLIQGESIGVGIAIVILLLVFRAVGSTWIPIILAAMGIAIATGTVALIGQFYNNIPFFVTNFITMIGLAVGIDYALFIVARYKEERSKGLAVEEAIARSGATANRAVFFSGMIVVIALVGMLIVPTTIFFGMALGAILVVLVTVLASLTFLPALLKLLGDKVYAWKIPVLQIKYFNSDISLGGFWNWVTMRVLKRPVIHLVGVATVLVALAIPYFDINLGFNGVETLPDDFRSKGAFTYLQEEFPEALGTLSSIDIVVDGGASSQQVRDGMEVLAKSIDSIPALGDAQPYVVSEDGDVGLLQIPLAVSGDSSKANDAVKELRERLIPMSGLPEGVLIGGATAINVAFIDLVSMWTPIVIGIVLALSFVLLLFVFRSILVPVKAILMNLLSVGAAYGLVVLVFQKGLGADLFGFTQVQFVEAWVPLFLFTILFGLSMDYEVFLLSRIRERFDQTGKNDESIAFGLRSTSAIITGAALIMVAVFMGFAVGDLATFQQFGFGLAMAILVDATIIRSVLVPATMKLLGDKNWYLPGFLKWLPDLRVHPSDDNLSTEVNGRID